MQKETGCSGCFFGNTWQHSIETKFSNYRWKSYLRTKYLIFEWYAYIKHQTLADNSLPGSAQKVVATLFAAQFDVNRETAVHLTSCFANPFAVSRVRRNKNTTDGRANFADWL